MIKVFPQSAAKGTERTGSSFNFLRNTLMRTLVSLFLVSWTLALWANPDNTLREITVNSLPGERVQITLTMEKPASKPVNFTIDNPARIALDFPGTKLGLTERRKAIGIGMAQSLNAVEAKGRTRVVINLSKMISYETHVKDHQVFVTLNSGSAGLNTASSDTPKPKTLTGANKQRITHIDFRRGQGGQGRVVVSLGNSSAGVDIRLEGDRIVADFLNADLPPEMERRLDVVDFATPVQNIETFRQGNHVRMIITPTGKFEHIAYQSENVYTIEVKPIKDQSVKRTTGIHGDFHGEKLTLNFQNIQVRSVLQLLADFTGINIVVSDTVKGSLTLRLKNVPWDHALDIILKTKGLAMRRENNVMRIAPTDEISAIEQADLIANKKREELAPLHTEWFRINYANAGDVLKTLTGGGSGSLKTGNSTVATLLSSRGKAVVDQRTNSLMVQETSEKLVEIRSLLKRLDIPVRQVLIESRIVIASNDFARDLGVKFGVSRSVANSNNNYVAAGGPQNTSGTLSNALMVDMGVDPAKSKAGRFGLAIGRLGAHILQLELSALQAEGKGEIISSPRLVTANQKEAFIEQGIEIPFAEATSSGAASVSFKKAVLSLKVTPQITPDDRIIMDLEVKKDSADLKTTIGVSQNVAINTREINTKVLVNNGETIVLGGVYESTKDNKVNRVPFLGNLPLVGGLFRDKAVIDNKSELLIFVTPKILKDDLTNESVN